MPIVYGGNLHELSPGGLVKEPASPSSRRRPTRFLEYAKAMKKNSTPRRHGARARVGRRQRLGAIGACGRIGGNAVDEDDKVIINSPETERRSNMPNSSTDNIIPGIAVLERSHQQQGFPGRRDQLDQQRHLDLRRGEEVDPTEEARSPRTWTTPIWPVGPVGKPTELHLMYPILVMNYTKYPQAAKALIAFMMEADQFNQWIDGGAGLS